MALFASLVALNDRPRNTALFAHDLRCCALPRRAALAARSLVFVSTRRSARRSARRSHTSQYPLLLVQLYSPAVATEPEHADVAEHANTLKHLGPVADHHDREAEDDDGKEEVYYHSSAERNGRRVRHLNRPSASHDLSGSLPRLPELVVGVPERGRAIVVGAAAGRPRTPAAEGGGGRKGRR